jgi:hypothetical protein
MAGPKDESIFVAVFRVSMLASYTTSFGTSNRSVQSQKLETDCAQSVDLKTGIELPQFKTPRNPLQELTALRQVKSAKTNS